LLIVQHFAINIYRLAVAVNSLKSNVTDHSIDKLAALGKKVDMV
jgi:hypothetical protein